MVDLTTLEGKDTPGKVASLCRKAIHPHPGGDYPSTAAVCVYPSMVRQAAKHVKGTSVRIASVATAFPSGVAPLKTRLAEVRQAVADGADEIDMVINRGAFLAGELALVQAVAANHNDVFVAPLLHARKSQLPRARPMTATLRTTTRTLHLVDIENLVGDPFATKEVALDALDRYLHTAGYRPGDQVILAANPGLLCQIALNLPIPCNVHAARGEDGADLILLAEAPAGLGCRPVRPSRRRQW